MPGYLLTTFPNYFCRLRRPGNLFAGPWLSGWAFGEYSCRPSLTVAVPAARAGSSSLNRIFDESPR